MWKDWLTFSKHERYGIVTLFVLVCIVAFLPLLFQYSIDHNNAADLNSEFYKVDSFFNSLSVKPDEQSRTFSFADEEVHVDKKNELFKFDPNTATIQQLMMLGFSLRQAQVIDRFRQKGGVFRNPSDFKKMYVVDSVMFAKLNGYISIDTFAISEPKVKDLHQTPEVVMVDINRADTLELIKLKGIGRGFARRIVAYRQLLGGYVNVNQLTEIWGFTPEMLENIKSNITIDSSRVQQININMVSFQDLKKHPYLTEYQSRAIIYYRETKGNIGSLDEILNNKLVDPETFRKVKGYLVVN